MSIVNISEEFYQLLQTLSSQEGTSDVFQEYEAAALGPDTITPFTDFTGQRDRPTIIISRHNDSNKDIEENSLSKSESNIEGLELIAELSTTLNSSEAKSEPVPILSHQAVAIGHPLTSKRVYLAKSAPFHSAGSNSMINTAIFAQGHPLSLDSARYVISLYALGCRKAKNLESPDIWVLCESSRQHIIALGCTYNHLNSTLMTFTVVEEELTTAADLKLKTTELVSLRNSPTNLFSEYEVASGTTDCAGQLNIQFSWTEFDGLFGPPPESADAVLKVACMPGDMFSPVLSMYHELRSLYRLCQLASDPNAVTDWCHSEEVLDSNTKTTITSDAIEDFIREMAHPLDSQADVTVLSPSTANMIYEARSDLDFAERLWLFSHSISNYSDLQYLFAEVFKAVVLHKVQPFVHRKSTSTLAQLLRQVLLSPDGGNLQEVAMKFQLLLTEKRLLACLVQIGIEKIKRDYQSFLIGADICSAEQYESFFTPSNCSSQIEQCIELCKIHSILELDALLMKMLKLPSSVLSGFTRAAMEMLKKDNSYEPFTRSPTFSIPLPGFSPALKSVVALCSKLSPAVWCLTADSSALRQPWSFRHNTTDKASYLIRSQPLLHYTSMDSTTSSQKSDMCYSYKCLCETISY